MLTKQQLAGIREDVAGESRLPSLFNALSDVTRFRIVRLLLQNRDLCVTELSQILEVSVPAVSQQLRILEMAGMIAPDRQGQKICYRLKKDNQLVRSLMRIIKATEQG